MYCEIYYILSMIDVAVEPAFLLLVCLFQQNDIAILKLTYIHEDLSQPRVYSLTSTNLCNISLWPQDLPIDFVTNTHTLSVCTYVCMIAIP